MKNYFLFLAILFLCLRCTSSKNSEDFINAATGRYLFNANEVLNIYFKSNILHAKWKGYKNIKLLKINDSTFYMKELNEKIIFVRKPEIHIELAEKTEHTRCKI